MRRFSSNGLEPAGRSFGVLARGLALISALSAACCAPAARNAGSLSEDAIQSPRLELPASLEHERSKYENDVLKGIDQVSDFFRSSGFDLSSRGLVDTVIVFDSSAKAREYFAREYGAPLENIPETFSGTVDGQKLFLVSRESYREIWRNLYSDWPWTDRTYRQLIVHELAHKAHESIAIMRYGSAEAMGPPWFFEGLAVVCAGQFETDQPLMSLDEIGRQVGSGNSPAVSYPLYGRIVRSLVARFEMKTLVSSASEPDFPEMQR